MNREMSSLGMTLAKDKKESVSPFELAGLSPEARTKKKKEIIGESGENRAEFLADSSIVEKTLEFWKSKKLQDVATDFIPWLGGGKMIRDALKGKTLISQEKLSTAKRYLYAAGGLVAEFAWTSVLLDQLADTDLTKYAVMAKLPGVALTVLSYIPDKATLVTQLTSLQEKLGPPASVLVGSLSQLVNHANFSTLDMNLFRSNLEEHFRQLSINPEING